MGLFVGWVGYSIYSTCYCEEIRVLKAGESLNMTAWDNDDDWWLLVASEDRSNRNRVGGIGIV